MALTPTLATPGLRVSAVTAAAAGTVVALEVMSLELIQSECFHFVISRLKALRAQAARLSAGAFLATIDDRVFREHVVASFVRRQRALQVADVLVIVLPAFQNALQLLKITQQQPYHTSISIFGSSNSSAFHLKSCHVRMNSWNRRRNPGLPLSEVSSFFSPLR